MANKLTPPPPTGIGILDRWLALLFHYLTATGQFVRAQISDFAHNHTGDTDGGALTNDLHDGYVEVATSAVPSTPAAGKMRVFAEDAGGVARLRAVHSTGSNLAFFRDAVVRVKNTSGGTINKGEVVYCTGATGNFPTIAKAKANAAGTMPAIGMVLTTAANNAFTTVQTAGEMTGLDTSAFAEGASLFVSSTTAGATTATEPQHPFLSQEVGFCTKSNAGAGSVQLFCTPAHEGDDYGSNRNTFSIGDGAAGAKALAFVNAFVGSLSWQPTAARTLTLPDATDTLVGKATTDTLSNKSHVSPTISSGNLVFSGSAQRITGDFSNATLLNRVLLQSSTTNSTTSFGIVPNGTATGANIAVFGSSDPDNASIATYAISAAAVIFNSTKTGTGTLLPIIFNAGGAEAFRLTTAQDAEFGATIKPKVYTVSTLPAAGTLGRTACVSDALAPTFLGALVGGGAVKTPVFDNGTAWVSY